MSAAGSITFVDLETAKKTPGVRLVIVSGIPSPWSESAKGLMRLKGIPFVVVRLEPGDKSVREWTRVKNAPVVMSDDEPARSGWSEILELVERLAPDPALVPSLPEERARMFGLAHAVLGEGGLVWSGRLVLIHEGLTTEGARGFPVMVAMYLARRYGYAKERAPLARTRIDETFTLLRDALGDRRYFFGDRPTALDVYVAAALNVFDVPKEKDCPMLPLLRTAFASVSGEVTIPPSLLALRERMYADHLELPIAF